MAMSPLWAATIILEYDERDRSLRPEPTPRIHRHDRMIEVLSAKRGGRAMEAGSLAHPVTVVVISGPIASGKTTLANDLHRLLKAEIISTSGLMRAMMGRGSDRGDLQRLGLTSTFQDGDWLVAALTRLVRADAEKHVVVIDAVRNLTQVSAVSRSVRGWGQVLHVQLTGRPSQLAARYSARHEEVASWDQAMRAPTEASASELATEADVIIDTTYASPIDVAVRVIARIRPSGTRREPCVDALVGGQWGSEGKGNLSFFLAPEYELLVRTGAPNAGHKVRDHDGGVYTHRQLPSGTRASEARLLLGAGSVIDINILLREIADCEVTPDRLTIDPAALIIEKDDVTSEVVLKQAIGSTGTGGGAALARRISQRGVPGAVRTARDMPALSPYVRDSAALLDDVYREGGRIFIEGTQGTGLSVLHGSFPHVTSRDTTVGTLIAEVGAPPGCLRRVVVAFRAYPIRVGGQSGPMGNEITWEAVAARSGQEVENLVGTELGSVSGNLRRVAEFSWEQLVKSVRLNGATDVALTFADYIDVRNRTARRVDQLTEETRQFIFEMEAVAGVPVSLVSASFDGRGPIDRRHW